jgi:predicted RNA-binding protein associated with RNAse of E/G family
MWSSGDSALLRFVRYGQVRRATPHLVVEDSAELVALYVPVGTLGKVAVWDGSPIRGQADRDWALRDHVWDTYRVLRLIRPGDSHSLELFWEDETRAFAGWYVNLQEPLRRAPLGFDTDDLVLDIWVEPDGTWEWKDEDELEQAVRLGRFTSTEAGQIRAEGERVLRERPWPTGWEDWRPDPEWPLPTLPERWNEL